MIGAISVNLRNISLPPFLSPSKHLVFYSIFVLLKSNYHYPVIIESFINTCFQGTQGFVCRLSMNVCVVVIYLIWGISFNTPRILKKIISKHYLRGDPPWGSRSGWPPWCSALCNGASHADYLAFLSFFFTLSCYLVCLLSLPPRKKMC